MTELWQLGALELARRIRTKQTTSREVLEAHLARVESVNGHLNAIVRLLDEEALAATDIADAGPPCSRHHPTSAGRQLTWHASGGDPWWSCRWLAGGSPDPVLDD